MLGIAGAIVVLIAWFPTSCVQTTMGLVSAGSPDSDTALPDPNSASCSSLLFEHLASIPGMSPHTRPPDISSTDVLSARLAVRALGVSAISLLGGLASGWWLARPGRRSDSTAVADTDSHS